MPDAGGQRTRQALALRRLWLFSLMIGLGCAGSPEGDPAVHKSPEAAAPTAEVSEAPLALEELRRSCVENPTFDACDEFYLRNWRAEEYQAIFDLVAELASRHPERWITAYMEGQVAFLTNNLDAGETHFANAVRASRNEGNDGGVARSLYMAGIVARGRDAEIAEARLIEAREHAAKAELTKTEIRVMYSLAGLYRQQGRFLEQRDALFAVLERLEDEDGVRTRRTLTALSGAQRRLGRLNEAQRTYDRLIELASDDPDQLSRGYVGRCVVSMDRGEFSRAAEDCARGAAVAATAGNVNLEAHARAITANALARAGRIEESTRMLEKISNRVGELDDWHRMIVSFVSGRTHWVSGRHDPSRAAYLEALDLAGRIEDPEISWLSRAGLARLARSRGALDEATSYAHAAVEEVEQLRDNIADRQERTHYLQTRSDVYRILASSLVEKDPGALDEAFRNVDRAHARTLAEAIGIVSEGEDARVRSLAATQRLLLPGDLLLEYLLGEDESIVIAFTRETASLHTLAARSDLESLVEDYRRALDRPLTSLDARLAPQRDFERHGGVGHELYRALLVPVADLADSASRLIVVPDRKLHLLPFETLPTAPLSSGERPRFLGHEKSIVYLPAAGFLEAPSAPAALDSTVVVANDNASGDLGFAPLAHAEFEANRTFAAYAGRQPRLLSGPDATLGNLLSEAERPIDVLHVVSHTSVQSGVGARVLLNPGSGGSRFLDSHTVQSLAHAPRIAVLSCCETAQGELVGGEGILGLVRAFTLAGTSTIVATLWRVDDETSARLMAGFHEELAAGIAPAEALKRARLAVQGDRFVHPFYWGPFVLYGAG